MRENTMGQSMQPLNAYAFLETLFKMTSRRVILAHSNIGQDGWRRFYLPVIAHLIRAGYHLRTGEALTGVDALVGKDSLVLELTGSIQSWASRNCGRCSPSERKMSFKPGGQDTERAITATITRSDMKSCLEDYLGSDCGKFKLGPRDIERFFDHISGKLPMHSDTASRVRLAVDDMQKSLFST